MLTEQEWTRLYDASAPHLQPILLLAYHLGQRFGEIMNLTWDRVDLQRPHCASSRRYQGKEASASADYPGRSHGLVRVGKGRRLTTNHVFFYEGQPTKSIKRAKRLAGVEDFRFHDLRHCAATNLRRAGVDTATAMKIVGHKSEKMWKRYNAIEEIDLISAAARLNTYLQSNTVLTPANSAVSSSL